MLFFKHTFDIFIKSFFFQLFYTSSNLRSIKLLEASRHSSISEINKVFFIYFDLMEVLVWFWFMVFNATFNNISAIL
jgi:hypothetical protein